MLLSLLAVVAASLDWSGVVQAALTLLTALLSMLAYRVYRWLDGRLTDERQRAILRHARDIVCDEVAAAEQHDRPVLVAALADGKLTPEEGAKLKALVILRARETLGKTGVAALNAATGERLVDGYLGSLAESELLRLRRTAPAETVSATTPSPPSSATLESTAGSGQ